MPLNNRINQTEEIVVKEKYQNAKIEVIRFENEDVITTSGGGGIEMPDDPIIDD